MSDQEQDQAAGSNKVVTWLITAARNSPWLFIAVGLHMIIGLAMSVVYLSHEAAKTEKAATTIGVSATRDEPAQEVIQPEEEIDRKKIPENDVEAELVTYEEETTFIPTEDEPQDLFQDLGDPTGSDDGGEAFTGGTSIGVGTGGHYGTGNPSAFASRTAAKSNKTRKGRRPSGITTGTEEAVLEGLRWLIRHQNEDGSWSVGGVASHCKGDKPCIVLEGEVNAKYDMGLTSLALLAFLGQGISVGSKIKIVDTAMGKEHQAGAVVKNGVKWLMDHQREDGALTTSEHAFMYNHLLASMALSEAYGISRNRELKRPAQKAVDFLIASQKQSHAGDRWGWRYDSKVDLDAALAAGQIKELDYPSIITDVDISHTCWAVMALKSAKIVGLDVPDDVMGGALAYAVSTTGKDGLVGYETAGQAGAFIKGPADHFTYHPGTMSSLGMLVRTFVQHDLADPFLDQASKVLVKDLPTVSKDKLSIDYYYWYYATLALNQFDGPDSPRKDAGKYWEPWNKALIESLLALQNDSKAREVCTRGGWIDADRWGSYTGHSLYATAINVLTLQVYYRYDNAFGATLEK